MEEVLHGKGARGIDAKPRDQVQSWLESGFGLGAKKKRGRNDFKRDVPSEAGIRVGWDVHQSSS